MRCGRYSTSGKERRVGDTRVVCFVARFLLNSYALVRIKLNQSTKQNQSESDALGSFAVRFGSASRWTSLTKQNNCLRVCRAENVRIQLSDLQNKNQPGTHSMFDSLNSGESIQSRFVCSVQSNSSSMTRAPPTQCGALRWHIFLPIRAFEHVSEHAGEPMGHCVAYS